jgi:hypothetical protein
MGPLYSRHRLAELRISTEPLALKTQRQQHRLALRYSILQPGGLRLWVGFSPDQSQRW